MTFFEDFIDLKSKMPHLGFRGFQNTNCEYNDYLYFSKDCFMCFNGDKFEHCAYCDEGVKMQFCYDCSNCRGSELCYECIDCVECYDSTYLQDCRRTNNSLFCYDCIGCSDCFGCAGLRQQQFTLFNKQLSEEEYKKQLQEWRKKGLPVIWEEFEKLKESIPRQYSMIYKTEDSTGNHIENCQKCYWGFNSSNMQECGYTTDLNVVYGEANRDTLEVLGGMDLDLCYECVSVGKGYNCNFLFYCEAVRDCDYCFQVFNSKNCFGCVGVNHGEFMILNKKYEEDEYFKKRTEIIEQMKKDGEWGKWPLPEGEKFDC
jgi:hypothetical protein